MDEATLYSTGIPPPRYSMRYFSGLVPMYERGWTKLMRPTRVNSAITLSYLQVNFNATLIRGLSSLPS